MQIDVIEEVRIGRLKGNLTYQEETRVELATIDDGFARVVLDFNDVRFVSAAAIESLVQASRRRRGRAPQLYLVNLNHFVKDVFTIPDLRLESMFTLCTDEQEAVTTLQKVKRQQCPTCGGTGIPFVPYPLNMCLRLLHLDKYLPCYKCAGHGELWQS